ncbi:PilN domain-containing protein [Candidatus Falkowbacteria bacterium]|nr:PilN domain-containing protein [Candidatus Falkowbacteria bacterium]
MITLNLISEQKKKEIKIKHLHLLLKKIDLVVIIFVCLIAILILVAKILLQNTFNTTIDQTTLITKNTQGSASKVRDINNKITSVDQVQTDFIVWTKLLDQLATSTPDDIVFTSVKASSDKNIRITGVAKTRDALIALKNSYEDVVMFDKFDFPLSNMLQKENINFEIVTKFKVESLKP